MKILRTPDEQFDQLQDYPWQPHFAEVEAEGIIGRVHYLDEGPPEGPVVLLVHGEPSWSYLYRHMVPPLVAAGCRVIVPDLMGFGKSDKFDDRTVYTYNRHVGWLQSLIFDHLDLSAIYLFAQDWGGLLSLRLVGTHGERFAGVVASNTFLPTGKSSLGAAFAAWREFSQTTPELPIGNIVAGGCVSGLSAAAIAAYEAPFPSEEFKEAARMFPALVPDQPDAGGAPENRAAWESLVNFDKPFITAFGDSDPVTAGADVVLRAKIAGAKNVDHYVVAGAGHFIQEDAGDTMAQVLLNLVHQTPVTATNITIIKNEA